MAIGLPLLHGKLKTTDVGISHISCLVTPLFYPLDKGVMLFYVNKIEGYR